MNLCTGRMGLHPGGGIYDCSVKLRYLVVPSLPSLNFTHRAHIGYVIPLYRYWVFWYSCSMIGIILHTSITMYVEVHKYFECYDCILIT